MALININRSECHMKKEEVSELRTRQWKAHEKWGNRLHSEEGVGKMRALSCLFVA